MNSLQQLIKVVDMNKTQIRIMSGLLKQHRKEFAVEYDNFAYHGNRLC